MNKLLGMFVVISLCLALVSPGVVFSASNGSGPYQKLLDSPDVKTRIHGTKLMIKDEVTRADLLEQVKKMLLAGYQTKTRDRNHYDEMAYYCKALAASGHIGYMELLKEVASKTPSRNLKRHAINAQKLLEDKVEMNQLLGSRKGWDTSLTDQENGLIQMLRSNSFRLKRDAGKQIYNQPAINSDVYRVVSEQLLDGLKLKDNDRVFLDGMAWLCKALGSSGLAEYKETLIQVKKETRNKKLRKYADQALRML